MNYNEYDSNGNKKKINFSDTISDKQQRSRLILIGYVFIFIVLIIMVRLGNTNTSKDENKENNQIIEEKHENDEFDDLFSLIDENNYEFDYQLNYDNELYEAVGKRYNNKYSYTFSKEGETPIEFLGTTNNIKAKVYNSIENAGLTYRYLNYFDNNIIKQILRSSKRVNDNTFEITNLALSKIIVEFNNISNNNINTIKISTKNNKIVEFEIDYSQAASELLNREISASVKAQFMNFNLIDDFIAEFE